MRKKPTHVYIIECLHGSPKRGAVFTSYVGITNNLERRLKEHYRGVGARYTRGHRPQRMCAARLRDLLGGEYGTGEIIEDKMQALPGNTKRAILQAAFGDITIQEASELGLDADRGDFRWFIVWARCPNQCQATFARDPITRRLEVAAMIHLGDEGGFNCPICKGEGGLFLAPTLEDCLIQHDIHFCDDCPEMETCRRPYLELGEDDPDLSEEDDP